MSSQSASPGSSPNVSVASTGSTAQQANVMTRNFILGIPKEGLAANSPEAADLQAAEAFVSDIQQEILAYDIANAKAMEAYATKWWSKVPYFGRHAKRTLEYEAAAAAARTEAAEGTAAARKERANITATAAATSDVATLSGSPGLHLTPEQVAAAMQVGGTYLHKQTSQTARGFKVERTSAIDPEQLSEFTKASGKVTGASLPPPPKVNSWLFRRQHPGWTPLMQRWWVPWLCVGSIILIWTPDVWKLRCLYICDHQYALLRQAIHKAYWRATMSKEDYEALMADIEAERPTKVTTTSCPFE